MFVHCTTHLVHAKKSLVLYMDPIHKLIHEYMLLLLLQTYLHHLCMHRRFHSTRNPYLTWILLLQTHTHTHQIPVRRFKQSLHMKFELHCLLYAVQFSQHYNLTHPLMSTHRRYTCTNIQKYLYHYKYNSHVHVVSVRDTLTAVGYQTWYTGGYMQTHIHIYKLVDRATYILSKYYV